MPRLTALKIESRAAGGAESKRVCRLKGVLLQRSASVTRNSSSFQFPAALWIGLGLVLLTLVAFWPVGKLGFVNLDDYGENGYVVENPHVHSGVTAASLKWAFTAAHASNWHPLTWISHMLDYQWFGANPAGHHWMNLAWHVANVVLLFGLLLRLTGNVWFAGLAAALWAVHPLRVESVAWVSERKDVLSGFFFLVTLLAWTQHARSSFTAGGGSFWKSRYYWLALVAFAGGLMSKPMLVSVPLMLLLVDCWPLQRFATGAARKWLLIEKIPFVALALAACVVTVWAQSRGGSIVAMERLPLTWRLINVPLAYIAYLEKIFWPQNLAVFYPYSQMQTSLAGFALALLVLAGLTWICLRERQRCPWLLVGWLWFGVMLLPVIGIMQVGLQSFADRYTYLPSLGIVMIVSWLLVHCASPSRVMRSVVVVIVAVGLLVLGVGVRRQLSYWNDSVALFRRALVVNGDDPTIRNYLANAYRMAGALDEAIAQYEAILKVAPESAAFQYRLGYLLMQQGRSEAAQDSFAKVLRLDPKHASAHMGLALLLVLEQKIEAGQNHFMEAMLLRPGDGEIRASLAEALRLLGSDRVRASLLEQLNRQPAAEVHARLAMIALTQNDYAEALRELEAARTLNPDDPEILNQLAWWLATSREPANRDAARAMELAARACALTQNCQARTLMTLGAALARDGRFLEACVQTEKAMAFAAAREESDLLARGKKLLSDYKLQRAHAD